MCHNHTPLHLYSIAVCVSQLTQVCTISFSLLRPFFTSPFPSLLLSLIGLLPPTPLFLPLSPSPLLHLSPSPSLFPPLSLLSFSSRTGSALQSVVAQTSIQIPRDQQAPTTHNEQTPVRESEFVSYMRVLFTGCDTEHPASHYTLLNTLLHTIHC